VSFYVRDARFAPNHTILAYTLVSPPPLSADIQPSLEGKEHVEELARIRKAIALLPAVEVVTLGTKPRPIAVIHRAELVGWLNDREILVAEDGRLVAYDSRGMKEKEMPLRLGTAADDFI